MRNMAGFLRTDVKFAKPVLSLEEQADLIIGRGLNADREHLIKCLRTVGYYRLCGYWHHLKQPNDSFLPGSDFEPVWVAYNFDRRLRLVVMDAIEHVEIAIRCEVYTQIVLRFGPFGHLDPANFPHAKPGQHEEMISRLRNEALRSKEIFVQHFKAKYDEFPDLPLWAAAQISTFGIVLTMLNTSGPEIRPLIAKQYKLQDTLFSSWLLTLNSTRNICAHHARLWNRELGLKPKVPDPKNAPDWHGPLGPKNNRIFFVLTMLRLLLRAIAPHSDWRQRVFDLFDAFPTIPLDPMGMHPRWRDHPLWQ